MGKIMKDGFKKILKGCIYFLRMWEEGISLFRLYFYFRGVGGTYNIGMGLIFFVFYDLGVFVRIIENLFLLGRLFGLDLVVWIRR